MNTVTVIGTKKEREQKIRVAAYCCVCTDACAKTDSMENQMASVRYQLTLHSNWELVDIYADESLSDTAIERRPSFLKMMEDCKDGKIDYIITMSISCFAHNTLDCIRYVQELQKYGTQIYFGNEDIDTGNSIHKMLLGMMASFAQEESRSISQNEKWGIRKRFEKSAEPRVPTYGYRHTENELFQIVPEEAGIIREIFNRYIHGEMPKYILEDIQARGIKPPAGDTWKQLQFWRIIGNEKYVGDMILQKTYVKSHLNHRQIQNEGKVKKFHIKNAHDAIVDRHIFEQAQKISAMRKVRNCTYPYGDMLICPHCGKPLMHGGLNYFCYGGVRIRNGGWGCYGEGGCSKYLLIQNILNEALLTAYEKKYGEKKETVEFYWLDDCVTQIELQEENVTIRWKDGMEATVQMNFCRDKFKPSAYAESYNDFLSRIRCGKTKAKSKYIMGLGGL